MLLEGGCVFCGYVFVYLVLGDYVYGEVFLCSVDGYYVVVVSVFDLVL